MSHFDLSEATKPFRDSTRYHRTGIVLVDDPDNSRLDALSLALPADVVSWPELLVGRLGKTQKWIDTRPEIVLEDLKILAKGPAPYTGRIVEGIDFALAKWIRYEIEAFWHRFVELERNAPHALLIVLPCRATHLLPHPAELDLLEKDKRVVRIGSSMVT